MLLHKYLSLCYNFLQYSVNFLCKIISISSFWIIFFLPYSDFITSCTEHLRILLHWVIQICQMLTYSMILYKIITFVTIIIALIGTVFMFWKNGEAHAGKYKFPIILIFTWKIEFYNWQKRCQLFSWKWQAYFVNFRENACQEPKSVNQSLSVSNSFKQKWSF